jgi:hypothetical protein
VAYSRGEFFALSRGRSFEGGRVKYAVAKGAGWVSVNLPAEVMAEWRVGTIISIGTEQRMVCGFDDTNGTRTFRLVKTEQLAEKE